MSLIKLHDKQLITKARKGNQQAFAAIVGRHEQGIRRIITGMLGQISGVDDIAQEVFIRFYKSINQFKGDAQLSTYLGRIAIRATLTAIEKRKKLNQRFPSSLTVVRDQRPNQYEAIDRLELKDTIQSALNKISEDHRAVVVLRLVQGYSLEETATMLSLPKGTVASRLSRAQLALRKILKP